MVEFKFACPQCAQNIQCAVSYAGSQIYCPACKQPIIVPQPATLVSPAGRTVESNPSNSSLWRNILIAGLFLALLAGAVIAFFCFGAGDSTCMIWNDWPALSGDKNQWSFENGKISGHSTTAETMLASPEKYGNVTFSATVNTPNREATLAIRMQDKDNGYLIVFAPDGTLILGNSGYIALIKEVSGGSIRIANFQKSALADIGLSAKIKVVARGSLIEVWVNGKKLLQATDDTFATGRIGLRIYGDPNYPCDATFSNVTIH